MSSDIDIKVGLNVDSSKVDVNLMKIGADARKSLNASLNSIVPSAVKNIALVSAQLSLLGGAAGVAIASVMKLVEVLKSFYDAMNGAEDAKNQTLKFEQKRLEILKMQIEYMKNMYDIQSKMNSAMYNADKIVNDIEREQAKRKAEVQAKRDKELADIERDANNAKKLYNQHKNWTRPDDVRSGAYPINRKDGLLWGKSNKFGLQGRNYSFEELKARLDVLGEQANAQIDAGSMRKKAAYEARYKEEDKKRDEDDARERTDREIEILRKKAEMQKQMAIDRLSLSPDADNFLIEKKHIEEEFAIRMDYLNKYEQERLKAGKDGIDVLKQNQLEADRDMALHQEQLRHDSEVKKKEALDKRVAEEKAAQEKLLKEQQKAQEQLQKAREEAQKKELQWQRDSAETAITSQSNANVSAIQAMSEFRQKLYEGFRNPADYQSALSERNYAIGKAQAQAGHEQEMQRLRQYDDERGLTGTARESVRADARFREQQALIDARYKEEQALLADRHEEQLAVIRMIKSDTGKIVNDTVNNYKTTLSKSWEHATDSAMRQEYVQHLAEIARNTQTLLKLPHFLNHPLLATWS